MTVHKRIARMYFGKTVAVTQTNCCGWLMVRRRFFISQLINRICEITVVPPSPTPMCVLVRKDCGKKIYCV